MFLRCGLGLCRLCVCVVRMNFYVIFFGVVCSIYFVYVSGACAWCVRYVFL